MMVVVVVFVFFFFCNTVHVWQGLKLHIPGGQNFMHGHQWATNITMANLIFKESDKE